MVDRSGRETCDLGAQFVAGPCTRGVDVGECLGLELAEVRTAVPLTQDQETRLAAALANATGKQVNLKVVVDPSVLGGIVATIGDTVIDGSVRTRIDQLKSRL